MSILISILASVFGLIAAAIYLIKIGKQKEKVKNYEQQEKQREASRKLRDRVARDSRFRDRVRDHFDK